MSLHIDRPLSQAMRYAHHRLFVCTKAEQLASALAFDHFAEQFDRQMRDRMTAVYLHTLNGTLVEDRRSRGKQLW
jgi:hypothetical protein